MTKPLDDLSLDYEVQEQAVAEEQPVPCEYLSGIAGTGKTFSVRQRIEADPEHGLLLATTGIAAMNLNSITLNSALGYFDTEDLRDKYLQGQLVTKLHQIAKEYRNLVIDEVSMMDAGQLDLIYRAIREVNRFKDVEQPLGIVLVGDFAQLPPVRARWAFEAECWPRFAANTVKLTKVWRQEQEGFLKALNLARCGQGQGAADKLTSLGVQWHTSLDTEFDGTTIVPKNDQVDRFNGIALDRVRGSKIIVRSQRWGKQRGEWKAIPDALELKLGAYVMLLANQSDGSGGFAYVNGDCGHVREWIAPSWNQRGYFKVELVRNGQVVDVYSLVRNFDSKDKPDGWAGGKAVVESDYVSYPHTRKGRYVQGQVSYYPLRLAYSSTVHRSQGLSLDRVQFDFRNHFAGSPAMMYVSLSRCRTLEGLRLVGQPDVFIKHCKIDPKVTPYI